MWVEEGRGGRGERTRLTLSIQIGIIRGKKNEGGDKNGGIGVLAVMLSTLFYICEGAE